MNSKERSIYIDISEFLRTRKTTGIQRVVRELLSRILSYSSNLYILDTQRDSHSFVQLSINEVHNFLQDIEHYTFQNFLEIDIFQKNTEEKIFLEIDTVWNAHVKRETLYPKLKSHSFKIYNFIYDLIPSLYPKFLYEKSQVNFPIFLNSVYQYSNLVIFNSKSAQTDFFNMQKKLNKIRKIQNYIIPLGSDLKKSTQYISTDYKELLKTKFILFVGTIEPRKEQLKVLEVFEEIYSQHPDLHLIFIGKLGWSFDAFIYSYQNSSLKEKNIHHLSNIDDDTLTLFYKNAYLVTYLSKYEGYGLPLVESLTYSKVTIALKNSSMQEFSNRFVDFVKDDSKQALKELLLYYINNQHILDLRQKEIKKNYKVITWDIFYTDLINIIENFDILTPLTQTKGDKH